MSEQKRARLWQCEAFPELTADWFRRRGVGDPEWVFGEWQRWLRQRKRSDDAKFRHALELAVGVASAAVSHWVSKEIDPHHNRAHELSRKTLKDLDAASFALGRQPRHPVVDVVDVPRGGVKRIVLLAQLAGVPSPRYHLSVVESIVRCCDAVNLSVSLHEVNQSDPDMAATVERVVRSSFPHGVIWFRLTPTPAALEAVGVYSNHLPCVMVHASRLRYPPPVIAHVVPVHTRIRSSVETWVRHLPSNGSRAVIVGAMKSDNLALEFPPVDAPTPASIREERRRLVIAGIEDAGCEAVVEDVEDYGANRAKDLAQKYPNALGYVCFSDEIALSLRQLHEAFGRRNDNRILGFDGSDLAKASGIPSFDQRLHDIGETVVAQFLTEFRRSKDPGGSMPVCKEVGVELTLLPSR